MELNFTELNNLDKSNDTVPFNYNKQSELNQPKYWEQTQQKNNTQKRKKVSFDDILTNMNLVVTQNGVLQSMAPSQQYNQSQYDQPQYNQSQYDQSQYNQPQYNQNQRTIQKSNEPIDHSVKHSYIFNKYFKDYKDANENFKAQPKVPKTIEEYKRMVFEEKVRQLQERNRIARIKSTKMFYTSNPNMPQSRVQNVIKATKNNLRSMKFG